MAPRPERRHDVAMRQAVEARYHALLRRNLASRISRLLTLTATVALIVAVWGRAGPTLPGAAAYLPPSPCFQALDDLGAKMTSLQSSRAAEVGRLLLSVPVCIF